MKCYCLRRNDGEKCSVRQDNTEQIGGNPAHGARAGPGSGEQAHDQPEIVTCDVDQIALVDVRAAAQPGASHATTIEDQSEAALHPFGLQPEGLARHARSRRARLLWRATAPRLMRRPRQNQRRAPLELIAKTKAITPATTLKRLADGRESCGPPLVLIPVISAAKQL